MALTTHGLFKFDGDSGEAYENVEKCFGNVDGNNMDKIDTLFTSVENNIAQLSTGLGTKATVLNKTATIGTSWSGSSPFTQEIELSDILETDTPIVDLVPSDDFNVATAEEEAWAKVYKIVTSAGKIKVYAKQKPSVALNIKLQIVR